MQNCLFLGCLVGWGRGSKKAPFRTSIFQPLTSATRPLLSYAFTVGVVLHTGWNLHLCWLYQWIMAGLVFVFMLLEFLFAQRSSAPGELADTLPEDADLDLIGTLVAHGLQVFPVNVTEGQQRHLFRSWIQGLQPVQQPQDEMEPWNEQMWVQTERTERKTDKTWLHMSCFLERNMVCPTSSFGTGGCFVWSSRHLQKGCFRIAHMTNFEHL